jgi:nucleoside-diphosphate-sugar epimerase
VEGIIRLLFYNAVKEETSPEPTGAIHQPVNLGNPTEISIVETAALIIRLTRSSSRTAHHALPKDDPKCRRPEISRARGLLNWEPRVSLEEGLGRTIDYFRGL